MMNSLIVHPLALTNREHQIAQLIARGFTNRAIGEILFIETRTVERHVGTIIEKCVGREMRNIYSPRVMITRMILGHSTNDN